MVTDRVPVEGEVLGGDDGHRRSSRMLLRVVRRLIASGHGAVADSVEAGFAEGLRPVRRPPFRANAGPVGWCQGGRCSAPWEIGGLLAGYFLAASK
jgi:hypothetical protein